MIDAAARFEHDRAQLLMDLDMAKDRCIKQGGIRLKWVREFQERLDDLKSRALTGEYVDALGQLRARRGH